MAPGPEDDPDPDNENPDNENPDDENPDDQNSGDDEPGPVNLSSMTKAQLLKYAEENGVQGVSDDMKKADILAKIEG